MNIIPVVEVSENVGRETGRKKRTGFTEPEIAAGVSWHALCGKPDAVRGEGHWVCDEGPLNTQLLSSELQLHKGQLYTFELQIEVDHAAPWRWS